MRQGRLRVVSKYAKKLTGIESIRSDLEEIYKDWDHLNNKIGCHKGGRCAIVDAYWDTTMEPYYDRSGIYSKLVAEDVKFHGGKKVTPTEEFGMLSAFVYANTERRDLQYEAQRLAKDALIIPKVVKKVLKDLDLPSGEVRKMHIIGSNWAATTVKQPAVVFEELSKMVVNKGLPDPFWDIFSFACSY